MENLSYANSFQELMVYKKSRELSKIIFTLSKDFPPDELYSLTSQIRKSSRSVGAQIAEAWAKRPYRKHFISKLTDADAELHETEHWTETAYSCGYLSKSDTEYVIQYCREIGRMLGSMIKKADRFCIEIQ